MFNVPWYEIMKNELKLCCIRTNTEKRGDSAFLKKKKNEGNACEITCCHIVVLGQC